MEEVKDLRRNLILLMKINSKKEYVYTQKLRLAISILKLFIFILYAIILQMCNNFKKVIKFFIHILTGNF